MMDCPKNGEDLGDGLIWWCDEGCYVCGGRGSVPIITFMAYHLQRKIAEQFLGGSR